jgi:hypothetical protein
MSTLREVLQRMWARPTNEVPEWVLAAKRSNRSVESIEAEVRSCGVRACPAPRVAAQHAVPVPIVTPAAIDTENRRRLLAVGREVYRDKSFRDSISDQLAGRAQHRKTLDDIKNLGRAILGEE